jgi:hypothetical protein
MSLQEYRNLGDYPGAGEVLRLTDLCLQESSDEAAILTLAKLRELGIRQWHTYDPAPDSIRERIREWLFKNWSQDSQEFLRYALVVAYCYGLDKGIYKMLLSEYQGETRWQFEKDLSQSKGPNIDPWWSLGPRRQV